MTIAINIISTICLAILAYSFFAMLVSLSFLSDSVDKLKILAVYLVMAGVVLVGIWA